MWKHTTTGRSILSTCSFTFFEVLLSMIVLPAAQVLLQSSDGIVSRATAKVFVRGVSSGFVVWDLDSPLPFPLFIMQGGSTDNLGFPPDINRNPHRLEHRVNGWEWTGVGEGRCVWITSMRSG